MLSYRTAGESHGPGILALIEGLPAGMQLNVAAIDAALARRQGGYGRGARQKIERDRAKILAGIRKGKTIGSPLAIWIANRDVRIDAIEPESVPRPGHADLAGMLKYGTKDLHDIAERASARETCGRVAAGAVAQQFLSLFGVEVAGYVVQIGARQIPPPGALTPRAARQARDASRFYTLRPQSDGRLVRVVDRARKRGDTLGGVVEARAWGVPAGVGSHAQWSDKLDGHLARAVMSIQAVKGVEIGDGFAAAARFGSAMHDGILRRGNKILRSANRAGGVEGGISNGQPVVVRAAMKPLSTLVEPLPSVDLASGRPARATVTRSDVCAVPACSVVLEAAVSIEIARAFLEKFPGDSILETVGAHRGFARRNSRFSAS